MSETVHHYANRADVPTGTLVEAFFGAVDRFGAAEAYAGVSYREVRNRVRRGASALARSGLSRGDRAAILSGNRLEWALADWSCLCAGVADVPIYSTLPAAQVRVHPQGLRGVAGLRVRRGAARQGARSRGRPRPLHRDRGFRRRGCGRGGRELGGLPGTRRRRRSGRLRGRRAARRPRGSGHADLHVGHDRDPQGRHADPEQPGVQSVGVLACARCRRRRQHHLLPAAVPRAAAAGGLPVLPSGVHDHARRDRHRGGGHEAPAPHRARLGSAPLREGPPVRDERGRREGQDRGLGRNGGPQGRAVPRARDGPSTVAQVAARDPGPPRLLQAAPGRGGAAALLRERGGGARARDQPVLPGRGDHDPGGVRADRNLAGHQRQHHGGLSGGHGGAPGAGHRDPHRRRRRDPDSRPPGDEGLLRDGGADPRGDQR